MLNAVLILLVQLVIFFLYIFAVHFAFHSAEKVSEWLTFPRLIRIFLGSVVVVVLGFLGLRELGWVQYGTPYDSPGFEQGREATKKEVEKAGPPPTIEKRVPKETIDASGQEHREKLKEFESTKSEKTE